MAVYVLYLCLSACSLQHLLACLYVCMYACTHTRSNKTNRNNDQRPQRQQ